MLPRTERTPLLVLTGQLGPVVFCDLIIVGFPNVVCHIRTVYFLC